MKTSGKRSTGHTFRVIKDDEIVVPYGMMTSLHVHVRGYVPVVNNETGKVSSLRFDFRRGNGAVTFFKDLGIVKDETVVKNAASQIYNQYVNDPKFQTDGTPVGKQTVSSFSRPGKIPNKKGNRPFVAKTEESIAL